LVLGGVGTVASGAMLFAYNNNNPVSGPRYTANNFRKNLEALKPKPSSMKNPQAHHVLPQSLESYFANLNININDPKWGAWVEGGTHQKWSNQYITEWKTWLNSHRHATVQDVTNQAGKLAKKYNFTWP